MRAEKQKSVRLQTGFCALLAVSIACFLAPIRAVSKTPPPADSSHLSASLAQPPEPHGELNLRIGNESNQADGIFGPFTYGITGSYDWSNQYGIEGVFMRLHEPDAPTFFSYLDEFSFALNFPPIRLLSQPLTTSLDIWRNRTIDMYLNVGSLGLSTDVSHFSFSGRVLAGDAARNDILGRFLGYQLGAAFTYGALEVGMSHTAGSIRRAGDQNEFGSGTYRTSAIESALDVGDIIQVPLTVTLDLEHRYFDFGLDGPVSAPEDSDILVLGIELNLFQLFHPS